MPCGRRYVTLSNVRHLLQKLGVTGVTHAQLTTTLNVLDRNRNGVVEFEDFFEFVAAQDCRVDDSGGTRNTSRRASVTRFTFDMLVPHPGKHAHVTVSALLQALSSLGAFVQVDELARVMSSYGHKGQLTYAMFAKMIAEHNRFVHWLV